VNICDNGLSLVIPLKAGLRIVGGREKSVTLVLLAWWKNQDRDQSITCEESENEEMLSGNNWGGIKKQ
jgi:hypothetical protein